MNYIYKEILHKIKKMKYQMILLRKKAIKNDQRDKFQGRQINIIYNKEGY